MEQNSIDPATTSATNSPRDGLLVPKFQGHYHQPDSVLVVHMLQELHYLVTQWQTEISQLESQIEVVRSSGPVVAGWIEPAKDEIRPDYQLCSLDENGQVTARDCPPAEMFGISKAVARHRQLRELLDHKEKLEQNIKHSLATLVQLRMDVN